MYKNYQKIVQSDFLNLPYKNHSWAPAREARIVPPGVLNLTRIFTSKWLGYMAYHKKNRTYYFIDRNEALIKSLDENLNLPVVEQLDGNSLVVQSVVGRNPDRSLTRPVAICINSLGHIFIGDHGDHGKKPSIVICNRHLNVNTIIENEHIITPSCMEIENIDENHFMLYMTDWRCSKLTVFKVKYSQTNDNYRFKYINSTRVLGPSTVRIGKKYVYVVSEVSWNWKNDENQEITNLLPDGVHYYKREVKRITSGLNAIIIYKKEKLTVVNIIELIHHLNPRGLYIDEEERIYTTAYKLSYRADAENRPDIDGLMERYFAITGENEQTERETLLSVFHEARFNDREFSADMYLIVFEKNGEILQETQLGIEYIADFLVYQQTDEKTRRIRDKILFMSQRDEPALHLLEFRDK